MSETALYWPEIRSAYDWVHRAARILGNSDKHDVATIRQEYQSLLDEIKRCRDEVHALSPAIDYFLKVTASYLPSLFHCYEVPDLPRTNNDLEQYFGRLAIWSGAPRGERRPLPDSWCAVQSE